MSALFDFSYPEHLIALEPKEPCRILDGDTTTEITREQLFNKFKTSDVLVINNSKVEKRRVINSDGLEILFLEPVSDGWQVLFPARNHEVGDVIPLPGGLSATLWQKGIPQVVQVQGNLTPAYFELYGELALPPYIQAARKDRHNWSQDKDWYQTHWAQTPGSVASPTASLHFSKVDLAQLQERGVEVLEVTLHVGAGTFLPLRSDNYREHVMHKEEAEISETVTKVLEEAKADGHRIWALGTTACRTVESWASGKLNHFPGDGVYRGRTDLFIYPGYEWKYVSGLLTNFHQPKTTLLALVQSFADRAKLEAAYKYAIQNQFRLFSYGDLTSWTR